MKLKSFKEINGKSSVDENLTGFTTIVRKNESIYIRPDKPTLKVLKKIKEDELLEDLSSFTAIIRGEEETIPSNELQFVVREGKNGQRGIDGKDGLIGKDGKDGIDGKDGLNGTNGKDGKDGVDGKTGRDGLEGKRGYKGNQGEKGDQGIPGLKGEQGLPGLKGKTGLKGEQGIAGNDGKDGKDGKDGINGVDGQDGKNGIDGVNGKDGLNGKDGKNGKDGLDGKDGKDGSQGLSGKDGRSIVGAKGTDGKNGEKGERGLQGLQGKQGINGLQGIQGLPGLNGKNGKDGKDGSIPKHEYQKGNLRFEITPGVWGSWIDLNTIVKKASSNKTHYAEGGGGAKAIEFVYKDLLVKDINRVTFDPTEFDVSYNGFNGLLVKSSNPIKHYIDVFTTTQDLMLYISTYIPLEYTETVTLRGLVLSPIIDYTISENIITFNDTISVSVNDIVSIRYQYDNRVIVSIPTIDNGFYGVGMQTTLTLDNGTYGTGTLVTSEIDAGTYGA